MDKNTTQEKIIITFPNETQVLKLESALKKQQIYCKLIPIPRIISAGCGICLEAYKNDQKICEEILEKEHIRFEGFH